MSFRFGRNGRNFCFGPLTETKTISKLFGLAFRLFWKKFIVSVEMVPKSKVSVKSPFRSDFILTKSFSHMQGRKKKKTKEEKKRKKAKRRVLVVARRFTLLRVSRNRDSDVLGRATHTSLFGNRSLAKRRLSNERLNCQFKMRKGNVSFAPNFIIFLSLQTSPHVFSYLLYILYIYFLKLLREISPKF